MGLIAKRVRMTEGQLYTIVILAALVLLLTLTGLPNAHEPTTSRTAPAPTTQSAP
ncbi:MAG TPA: hypothetical protein VGJ03_00705 [Acidimicrobiales bacterium]|jgi:hypothetical protein